MYCFQIIRLLQKIQKSQMQSQQKIRLFLILFISYVRRFHCADTYSNYFGVNADAMDYHAASNTIVFATSTFQLKFVNALTKASITSITTTHFATITTVQFSSDGSLVFTGGRDFQFQIIQVSPYSVLCSQNNLRGEIQEATIFDDLNRFSFVTNQGFVYYGNITNCTLRYGYIVDNNFISVESINSRDQVWLLDQTDHLIYRIYFYDWSALVFAVPTKNLQSIFKIPSSSYLGVCTQRAFYIIDYSGNILFTHDYPTTVTFKCTIKELSTNLYALTAISEQQEIYVGGSYSQPLWNVWRLSTNPTFSMHLIYEQFNDATDRYSNNNDQVRNAFTISYSANQLYVASVGYGYNPYLNYYGKPTSGCDSGLFSNSGTCQFCGYNSLLRSSCKTCSNAPVCSTCFSYKYLQTGTKACLPCSSNCHTCSGPTNCLGCVGGYVLVGSSCVADNITGCGTSYWDNGDSLSRCQECQIGYYVAEGKSCHLCSVKFQNCSECDISSCTKCEPNFFMSSPSVCEICSKYNEGCASCLNLTYCEACYLDYPYFDSSMSERACKKSCLSTCLTCNINQYDECLTCHANRTQNGIQCDCRVTEFIEDPATLLCIACRDYISDCQNCSTVTFCDTCDANFFFNNISATQQTCKACNYTCLTCDTYWFKCSTCDTGNHFRVLNVDTSKCVCQVLSYFEYSGNLICELCSDHMPNCISCYNETYCIACDSGYFIDSISTGVNQCSACNLPCTQCFNTNNRCTHCAAGRQLDTAANTCNCEIGYYPTGTVSCAVCTSVLGACELCNNDTVCIQCYPNNYFMMEGGAKKCAICQNTCLTCNVYFNLCATCDASAHRTLNPITQQCICETGYTQTDGLCLNCAGTFQHCNSCDLSRCYSCDPGYSLAFEGLKCIDCETTYPGCILCLNGVCAACNATGNYELSVTKCICSPGHYFKELLCLPYQMGSRVKRTFPAYASYIQQMDSDTVVIKIYFQTFKLYLPASVEQSVTFSINGETVPYTYIQDNTTFYFYYQPTDQSSSNQIQIQFGNKTIFDLDEYPPKQHIFTFKKNIYMNSSYELSTNFATFYQEQFIEPVRWIFTVFLIIGSTDVIITFIFIIHFIPAFTLLGLSIPMPLEHVLNSMIKINRQSLFILSDLDLQFETYNETTYIESYGLQASIVDIKVMDLIIIASVAAFYGIVGPFIYSKMPQGKIKQWMEYKFIFKMYSTISSIFICFIPSFLLSAAVNFEMQKHNPNLTLSVGISLILVSISGIFIFLHVIILLVTQFEENYKNQESYLGSSPLQKRSILYLISILIVVGWGIPLLYGLDGIYSLPLLMALLLFHITCFRNWDNFPSKILYFIKLFFALFLLIYVTAFLVYYISENYSTVSIDALEVIGLATLVNVIVLLSLSLLDALFLTLQSIYRIVRSNSNMVTNLGEQDNQQVDENQSTATVKVNGREREISPYQYDRKDTLTVKRDKLTDKKQHMYNFRIRHLRETKHNG